MLHTAGRKQHAVCCNYSEVNFRLINAMILEAAANWSGIYMKSIIDSVFFLLSDCNWKFYV